MILLVLLLYLFASIVGTGIEVSAGRGLELVSDVDPLSISYEISLSLLLQLEHPLRLLLAHRPQYRLQLGVVVRVEHLDLQSGQNPAVAHNSLGDQLYLRRDNLPWFCHSSQR